MIRENMTNSEKKSFLLSQLGALESKRDQLSAFEKELREISKKCSDVVDVSTDDVIYDCKFLLKADTLNCIGRDVASLCHIACREMERELKNMRERIGNMSDSSKGERA